MEDKYLDNVFREKLELSQQHDFDESAWLDLESRLEEQPKRRVIVPWRWLAAAGVLLPMLMMSFYFYYELKQTEHQLAKLETRMNNLLNKKEVNTNELVRAEKSLAMNDDLAENAGNVRQSTSETKSIEPVSIQATVSNSTLSIDKFSNKNITLAPTIQSSVSTTNTETTTKNTVTKNYKEVIVKEEKEAITASTLTPLAKAKSDTRAANAFYLNPKNEIAVSGFQQQKTTPNLNHLNMIYNDNTLKTKENLWRQTTEYVVPVGFEVSTGVFRGIQVPTTTPLATIQNEKPYFSNYGVEVAANFINGVDLTVGANQAEYKYTTTTIGHDFPNSEPNNVGDVFHHVTVTDKIIQVPVGLKYNFGGYNDVFAPFVEIGGIAKRIVEKEHSFEYLPLSRGDGTYKIRKPKKVSDSFSMNTASVSGGLKWNPNMKNEILDNVVIQAETFVYADFETAQPAWTAGVGVSMNYMF